MLRRLFTTLVLLIGLGLALAAPASANQFVSQAITVTDTTTSALEIPTGSGLGMVLTIDVSAIGAGDTWTFKAQWLSPAGNAIDLTATSANVTAAGGVALLLVSPYSAATATPFPVKVVATRSVAGGDPTVTYRVVGVFNSAGGLGDAQRYLVYDGATACWQHYGTSGLEQQFCPGGFRVEVTCPSDLNTVPFGGWCKDFTTSPPTIRYRGTLEAIP